MAINLRSISTQFQDLDWKEIGTWPTFPKVFLLILVFAIVSAASWFLVLSDQLAELDLVKQQEEKLKQDYKNRLVQSVNLEKLKAQKEEVTRYVADLEKQLPNKTEMDRLLSDINYAGISKGLQFEIFKPSAEVIQNYYAEVPITIKLSGSYHKLASFAADLSALPRIVTLNNIHLVAQTNTANTNTNANANIINGTAAVNNSTLLTLDATAKTFRYLDQEEVNNIAKLKNKDGATK